MFVLDSSALIEVVENGPKVEEIENVLGDSPLITTSISMHEFFSGIETEKEKFIAVGLMSGIRVLIHDRESALAGAAIERRLRSQGRMVNKADILIAGICKVHSAEIVSLDKDFKRITEVPAHIV